MRTPKEKAAALAGAHGFQITTERNHSTVSAVRFCKWFTVWRYSHGYLSFDGCEDAFSAHPEWRAA